MINSFRNLVKEPFLRLSFLIT